MMPRIAFIPIARTTFDIELAQRVTDSMRQHLAASPLLVEGPDYLITDLGSLQSALQTLVDNPPDLVLIFQATFADSSMVMALAEALDAPIFLWAVPEEHLGGRRRLNSICGINLAGHALTRSGRKYGYIYATPGDSQGMQKLLAFARAGYVRNLMRHAKLVVWAKIRMVLKLAFSTLNEYATFWGQKWCNLIWLMNSSRWLERLILI